MTESELFFTIDFYWETNRAKCEGERVFQFYNNRSMYKLETFAWELFSLFVRVNIFLIVLKVSKASIYSRKLRINLSRINFYSTIYRHWQFLTHFALIFLCFLSIMCFLLPKTFSLHSHFIHNSYNRKECESYFFLLLLIIKLFYWTIVIR